MAKLAHHPSCFEQFPLANDRLVVGGMELPRLAERVGTTPFYAYDRESVTARIQQLRQSMPSQLHVHYAMKANPMPALVAHIVPQVDGLDVASAGELAVALDAGCNPGAISFAGPGKRDPELSVAIAAGVTLNVESESELQRIASIAEQQERIAKVAIRVNPDFELKTSGMKMSGAKQFGIDSERVPQVLRSLGAMPVEFIGLHIFSGSQNLRADALIEAQNSTFALAQQLSEHAPAPIQLLNIGGGFGIPYFPGDAPLELSPIGGNLDVCLEKASVSLPGCTIAIELGRYLVGEAGVYVARVIDRKESRGKVFLITDGGLHHHLAASGNFGQVLRKNYPVVVGNRVIGERRETVSVVGPLCTPLDLLADNIELAEAEVGDLIAVMQSGAYGLTASPTHFLSHPTPKQVLV